MKLTPLAKTTFTRLIVIASLLVTLLIIHSSWTFASSDIGVKANLEIEGEMVSSEVSPRIISDRTLVPVRTISENLGWNVEWIPSSREVLITRDDGELYVLLTVGDSNALIDDEEYKMDVPPTIVQDRTLVPVRFVAEAFGRDVGWEQETRTVKIASRSDEDEEKQEPRDDESDDESEREEAPPAGDSVVKDISFVDEDDVFGLEIPISGSYDADIFRESDEEITLLISGIESNTSSMSRYSFEKDKPVKRAQIRPAAGDDEVFAIIELHEDATYDVQKKDNGVYVQFARVNHIDINEKGTVRVKTNIAIDPRAFTLSDPSRVVIDFVGAVGSEHVRDSTINGRLISGYRIGRHRISEGDDFEGLRIVLDLNEELTPVVDNFKEGDQYVTEVSLDQSSVAGHVIVVDPGHGGDKPGAVGPEGTKEKDVVLDISLRIEEVLSQAGAEVIMTRTGDYGINDIYERPEMANSIDADAFISVHANADPRGNAEGTETYYHVNNHPHSEVLARALHSEIVGSLGRPDRGVRTANFAVLRTCDVPAVLLEIMYLSSPKEERLLQQPHLQQNVAQSVLAGLEQFFASR